jgi:Ran GTPase-activating protein (RanGAP) involved in mRNA processing and transport
LKEGSAVTSLKFVEFSFPDGGSEKIASALKRNATLTHFFINSDNINEPFYDPMAASLLSNLTLQELTIVNTGRIKPSGVTVSPLFLALGMNTALKSLSVTGFTFAGELCSALQDGLGKNSTLERLELRNVNLAEAGVTVLSLYFAIIKAVQANKTLKALYLCYESTQMTDDEVKEMTSLVKQNYGLESLPRWYLNDDGLQSSKVSRY